MCPIRHFKSLVKFIDSYNNFIFAADTHGNIAIFLINEKDMENDDDTLKVQIIESDGSHIEYFKFIRDRMELMMVTSGGMLLVVKVEQTQYD